MSFVSGDTWWPWKPSPRGFVTCHSTHEPRVFFSITIWCARYQCNEAVLLLPHNCVESLLLCTGLQIASKKKTHHHGTCATDAAHGVVSAQRRVTRCADLANAILTQQKPSTCTLTQAERGTHQHTRNHVILCTGVSSVTCKRVAERLCEA